VETTVRVTFSGFRILRFAIPATLFLWIALSAYVVAYTGPPPVCGILLVVPVVLLVWVASATAGRITWDVDASGYSVHRGDRVTRYIPWGEVRWIVATGASGSPIVWMKIVDRAGRTRANALTSPVIGVDDIKILYEAAAYYSEDFGVIATNNLGWQPNLPMTGSIEAVGERPQVWPHVALSLLIAGTLILVTGAYEGVAAPISFGAGLIVIAVLMLALDRRRSKRRQRPTCDGST